MNVAPSTARARGIALESRPRAPAAYFTVTLSTLEPAPWRPESPAQRATNCALPARGPPPRPPDPPPGRATTRAPPEGGGPGVAPPPWAPAVTTCSVQLAEPDGHEETTIASPPCAPLSAPLTVILPLADLSCF